MPLLSGGKIAFEVSVNGNPIPGLMRASIANTNCFSADTYSLTFASGSPSYGNIDFWSTIASAYVEVTAVVSSTSGSTSQSLITGMIDTIHVDPLQATVGVEGRDLSSLMIDSYRQQDFVNQTASEIVATIAQYHGLQAVVTPTTGNIGRYYSDGYTKLSLGQFSRLQSDWDLVVQLARQNDFDVFVQGQTIFFQPTSESLSTPVPISVRDVQCARLERNLGISSNTAARVQSWNSQNMAAYDSDKSDGQAIVNLGSSIAGLPFLFSGSNYTSQQVTDSALRYTAELQRLGTVLHLIMPWSLWLSPRTTILLSGTDSTFDTFYRTDSVERNFCSTSGSNQVVRAAQIAYETL